MSWFYKDGELAMQDKDTALAVHQAFTYYIIISSILALSCNIFNCSTSKPTPLPVQAGPI